MNFDEEFITFMIEETSITYQDAMSSLEALFLREAINSEIKSIIKNNTSILTYLPPKCKHLGCEWIFKKQLKVDGFVERYKAQLVAQGFGQKASLDFFDTYSPVAHIFTIRVFLALAFIHKLLVYQMDVKITFFHGDLEKEIYMRQSEDFSMSRQENKICKLVKSLYELK